MLTQGNGLAIRGITPRPPSVYRVCFDMGTLLGAGLGDDVRIKFRDHGMDPDHSAMMIEHGLKPGDRPGKGRGAELYPEIWARR